MLQGKLTNKIFSSINDTNKFNRFNVEDCTSNLFESPLMIRYAFIEKYGFFVATTEWVDQVAKILQDRQPILEVCAGTGTVAKIMQDKGLSWLGTDLSPSGDLVLQMGALEAIEYYKPKTVFMSWVDLDSDLDCEIANTGYPIIMVGEGEGGCTGSDELWSSHIVKHITDIYPNFINSVPWYGLHDTTWLINWSA